MLVLGCSRSNSEKPMEHLAKEMAAFKQAWGKFLLTYLAEDVLTLGDANENPEQTILVSDIRTFLKNAKKSTQLDGFQKSSASCDKTGSNESGDRLESQAESGPDTQHYSAYRGLQDFVTKHATSKPFETEGITHRVPDASKKYKLSKRAALYARYKNLTLHNVQMKWTEAHKRGEEFSAWQPWCRVRGQGSQKVEKLKLKGRFASRWLLQEHQELERRKEEEEAATQLHGDISYIVDGETGKALLLPHQVDGRIWFLEPVAAASCSHCLLVSHHVPTCTCNRTDLPHAAI